MKRLLLLFSIISLLLISCEESKLKEEAYIIERNELETSVGFDWFRQNYNDYQPIQTVTEMISASYSGNEKFVIFVKPTCSCKGTQLDFPSLVKTFDQSNLAVEKYEIWACAKEDYEHPYMSQLEIMDLPACYLFRDGVPVYSVLDTFNLRSNNNNLKIEEVVLEALEK